MRYDVAIVGAGPAGSTCAALCAQAGMRTLLIERSTFPRDKVCGDCVNPACWPIFDRLDVSGRVLAQPHSQLSAVEFVDMNGRSIRVPLPRGKVAITRRLLDDVLRARAVECGVEVREGVTVTTLARGWTIETDAGAFSAKTLVAADGRNSTVARLLGLQPAATRDRIGLQTHLPAPSGFGEKVAMHFLAHGYAGVASVGGGQLTLCLVARAPHLDAIKAWAAHTFALPADQPWRTITPLTRRDIPPAHDDLLLVGDAARVVEPFTGEGIYYALATGALAAERIAAGDLRGYAGAHARLYRGRLWINRLAQAAVLSPRLASFALGFASIRPELLRYLTAKVVGTPVPSA